MLKDVIENSDPWEILIMARWCYRNGVEFVSEDFYDKLENLLREMEPDNEYLNRSYVDDPEPIELMNKYDIHIRTEKLSNKGITRYEDILTDSKGISVRPVRTLEEAYQWYQQYNGYEILHSINEFIKDNYIKIDKMYY